MKIQQIIRFILKQHQLTTKEYHYIDLENFKDEILQAMKQEVQDLKQELAQYKEQVSNTNINK